MFLGAAPLVGEQMGHLSGTALGIYMGLVPAGFMVGSYAVGRVGGRWSSLKCMLAGRFLTSLGLTAGIALVFSGSTHPLAFFGPCICVGLGNGLTLPAANARVLSLDPGMAGTASGLASAITMAGAGSMAFLAGLLMDGPNVRLTVLIAMLTTAFASLAAASFIARIEK
jgi:DHA1 family bicyclomycin/chloramphenicol resistance-like MFS transporter